MSDEEFEPFRVKFQEIYKRNLKAIKYLDDVTIPQQQREKFIGNYQAILGELDTLVMYLIKRI